MAFKAILFGIITCIVGASASSDILATAGTTKVDVFISGQAGYFCFKIPTVFQAFDGTLLAFSEARGGECWDWDPTDIVISRSTNNGLNWSEPEVVVPGLYEEHRVAGNIAPIQDRTTGRLFLPFNRGNIEAWMTYSDDNGLTWFEPFEIPGVIDRSWTWVGFGPPAGIQSSSGRLLVPAYYSTSIIYDNGLLTSAYVMYSDDHGVTWKNSNRVRNAPFAFLSGILGNENQIAQFSDGRLIMNSRTLFGARIVSFSEDDGLTWSRMKRTEFLPSPAFGVEGSTLIVNIDGTDVVYYSGPNSNSSLRLDMTIFRSSDGLLWEEVTLVEIGQVGYSSLLHMHNGKIAILYGFSDTKSVFFVPGKIILQIFDVNISFPGPIPSFPIESYNMSWQEEYEFFDYYESAGYYAQVSLNQMTMIVTFCVLVIFFSFTCITFFCRGFCSRHCKRYPQPKNEPELDLFHYNINVIVFVVFATGIIICFLIGFASTIVQYLLKYDDPVRYSRQNWNGWGIGYILCLVFVVLYLVFYHFWKRYSLRKVAEEEARGGKKIQARWD